jgi:hypothetical protein
MNNNWCASFVKFGYITGFSIRAVVYNFVMPTGKGSLRFTCLALPTTDDGAKICLAYQVWHQYNNTCKRKAPHCSLAPAKTTCLVVWCTKHSKNPAK